MQFLLSEAQLIVIHPRPLQQLFLKLLNLQDRPIRRSENHGQWDEQLLLWTRQRGVADVICWAGSFKASSNFPWNAWLVGRSSFQINAPYDPVSSNFIDCIRHHQACYRPRRQRVGPRQWWRTSWTKLSVFQDVRDNFMLCTSLHLLEGNRLMQIYIFEFWVDFQFPFSYSVPYWFPLHQPNSHFGCFCVRVGISLRQVVIEMLFVAQVPMLSHVHPTELYFRRSSRQGHPRQASVSTGVKLKKPWADWKEINTWIWQNAKHMNESFWWFNRQHFVLGYLAQALDRDIQIHYIKTWVQCTAGQWRCCSSCRDCKVIRRQLMGHETGETTGCVSCMWLFFQTALCMLQLHASLESGALQAYLCAWREISAQKKFVSGFLHFHVNTQGLLTSLQRLSVGLAKSL